MKFPFARLLIFAKAPIPGQTKTRLIPVLGAEGAAALQARLCERTFALAASAALAPTDVWCAPNADHPFFAGFAEHCNFRWRTQHGPDLGARMSNALQATLKDHGPAVLIGTDCPEMQPSYLDSAFAALTGGYDAVLGPAADGGYVLIGLSRHDPVLFERLDWGTEHVLRQTRECLRRIGWRWLELPTLWDIDRPEDLAASELRAMLPMSYQVGSNK